MQPCLIANDRLSCLTRQTTLAIAILTTVAFNITDLSVRVDISANMVALISGYAFLAIHWRFVRQNAEVARAIISFGQLATVILMGIMLSYAASTVQMPYRDVDLYAVDRWFGFEREAYMAFLSHHDGLRDVLFFAYMSMMYQQILVVVASIVARRIDRLQVYIIAFAIAVTATAAIASVMPAENAMIYVDKVSTGLSTLPDGRHSYFPTLQGLRDGTLRIIDFAHMEGLISFPSFHTADALLFVWALWPIRVLRVVLVPLNLLLIAATPLCGAHYVADIAGGAAVALGAIVITTWVVYMPPAKERIVGDSLLLHRSNFPYSKT